jgi:nicotinamidase-related amidase
MTLWPFTTPLVKLVSPVAGDLHVSRAIADRNDELAHEAFELFAAMAIEESHEAMFRAFRLHRLARNAGFTDTQVAGEALEIALVCSESCDTRAVHRACNQLVQTMILDGLLRSVAVDGLDSETAANAGRTL